MKRKIFYSVWMKILLTILMLICAGLTAFCGAWMLIGIREGNMTMQEVIHPVPYEESSAAASYLSHEAEEQISELLSVDQMLSGQAYDASLTVDISNLDAGVSNGQKDANLEYTLGDLAEFYNSDGYKLLKWIREDVGVYTYDEWYDTYSDEDTSEDDAAAAMAAQTETGTENNPEAYTEPQPVDVVTESLDEDADFADMGFSDALRNYSVKCYTNEEDVLYGNGIEIEKNYLLPVNGISLAEYTRRNGQESMLSEYYDDLLDAAKRAAASENSGTVEESNAFLYLRNTGTGEVYTNVSDWSGYSSLAALTSSDEMNSLAAYVYCFEDVSDVTAKGSSELSSIAGTLQSCVYDQFGSDDSWEILVGLDAKYSVKDSISYYRSMFDSAYLELGANPFLGNAFLLFWVFLGFAGFFLILMGCQTGRRAEGDRIHSVMMDRFPIELLFLRDLICWILIFAFASGVSYYSYSENVTAASLWSQILPVLARGSISGILAAALLAWEMKQYVRRIRERKLGGSIIGSIVRALRHTAKEVRQTVQDAYLAKKTNQRLLITCLVILAVQSVGIMCFMVFAMNYMPILAILVIAALVWFDIFAYLKILKSASGKEAIKEGIRNLAEGNLDYQINTEHMTGENLELAQEFNQVRDGVRKAVDIQMKSERLKTDLITNVSHDIKTPLTSIINYVDILKRENIPDERISGYIEILNNKALRLKQLTEDLVEASKISSGNITLTMQEINLKQLIKQTNGEFEEKFAAKELELICTLPEEEQLLIKADGRRMFRVIENLYNNAAKYSMPCSRVYVSGERKDGTIVFSMKNMSESPLNFKADELLERFVRGDVSRSTEGSGLGLEIARNLTMMQGGTFDLYLDGDLFKVTITFPEHPETKNEEA